MRKGTGGGVCVVALTLRPSLRPTVGAPAVPAGGVFDGGGGGQLHPGEEAGPGGQLDAFPIQLARQGDLHGFVGKRRAVAGQTGALVEVQNLLSVTGEEKVR